MLDSVIVLHGYIVSARLHLKMRAPGNSEEHSISPLSSRRQSSRTNASGKIREMSMFCNDMKPSSFHNPNTIHSQGSSFDTTTATKATGVNENAQKSPTVINFDFKQNSMSSSSSNSIRPTSSRSRNNKSHTVESLPTSSAESAISLCGAGKGRADVLSNVNNSSKEYFGTHTTSNVKENTKYTRKDSLDSFKPFHGGFSHQHQNGTFSSTSFKDSPFFSSSSVELQHTYNNNNNNNSHNFGAEKPKKPTKSHKIKCPSKSIAMNLNAHDVVVVGAKKKLKSKRPLTSGNGPLHDANPSVDNTNFSIQKITTTRIFSNHNHNSSNGVNGKSSGRKEKENLPPINKFQGQNQIMSTFPNVNEKEGNRLSCTKCNSMVRKLKAQVEVAKTLQRQNGCLENIVTQKRNLVEQLTRQVKNLVRENQQLSKVSAKMSYESILPAEYAVMRATGNSNNGGKNQDCTCQENGDQSTNNESTLEMSFAEDGTRKSGTKERSASSPSKKNPKKSESSEQLEQVQQRLLSWNLKLDVLQQSHDQIKKENEEMNRFLTNLLYTLNARGYESVMDPDGNTIDLYRCKGQSFLDLRGRDVRQRNPVKRNSPQETLLKAVIGSQERIIQSLLAQLEHKSQKDTLLENCSSVENVSSPEHNNNNNNCSQIQPPFSHKLADVDLINRDFENPGLTKTLNLSPRGLLPQLLTTKTHRHHHSPLTRNMSNNGPSPFLCAGGRTNNAQQSSNRSVKLKAPNISENRLIIPSPSSTNGNFNSNHSQSVFPPDNKNIQCTSGDRCPLCSHQF